MACDAPGCGCGPECGCGAGCGCSAKMASIAERVALRSRDQETQDFWVDREEVARICPPCAERMASLRIRRVLASAIFGQDMLELASERTADKWQGMPKGWSGKSRKKLWESLGGSVKDCMSKMEGKVDDAGSFCASLKDRVEKTTHWRGPED